MATIARQIDALGGAAVGDWSKGYTAALEAAEPIAEIADAQIAELIEIIEDALTGNFGDLAKWATDARRTVNGIKAERARS
jgi:hypothetical protein